MRRRILAVPLAVFAILIVLVLSRTFLARSRQIAAALVADPPVNAASVAGHLAGAIRFPTVSTDIPDDAAFRGLAGYFAATYPRVHSTLTRETVSDYSLLYTWTGSDPSLPPLLMAGHLDVVPVDAATAPKWTHPPFSGDVAEGYLWGRGTLDDKITPVCLLEAVETLLAQGFQPKRTVYLAFGHDEESTGRKGAMQIVAILKKRGVKLEYALDEGSFVTKGIVPGIDRPVAVVAVAEKGFVDVELRVPGTGGHSSAPPEHTAAGVLAKAIEAVEASPYPYDIRPPQEQFFEYAAPEMGFGMRLALSNLWLFQPLIIRTMAAAPLTRAGLHTTQAVTMLQASPQSNVLPTEARAVINYRLLPGDRIERVLDRLRRNIDNPRIQIRAIDGFEASPVSDIESPAGLAIQRAIRESFPDTVVAPNLMIGAADVRYYATIARNAYRFIPAVVGPDISERAHGIDERIAAADLDKSVRFYARLLAGTASR